jgi:hypothetical protein
MRVLNEREDRNIIEWHLEDAVVNRWVSGANRLSSKSLNGGYFIVERPSDQQLAVALSKTSAFKLV